MIKRLLGAVFFGGLLTSGASLAHHSLSGVYDIRKSGELTGVVTKVEFTNPHGAMHIAVDNDDGAKTEWVLNAWTETWLRPSMRNWTVAPELPNLHCPLLVIHGELDEFTSLEQPRRMAELAGGPARLRGGAGHPLRGPRPRVRVRHAGWTSVHPCRIRPSAR